MIIRLLTSLVGITILLSVIFFPLDNKSILLPTFSGFINAFKELFINQNLLGDILISFTRIFIGFILSCIAAMIVAMVLLRSKFMRNSTLPVLNFIRYLPVPALVPLTILWFGVGEFQKVMIVFIGVFFQLVFLILEDLESVPRNMIDVSRSFGLSENEIINKVITPYAMPLIFENFRITLAWAWGWLLLAELVGANSGIGYVITKAQRFILVDQIFASLFIVGGIGIISDSLFRILNSHVFKWYNKSSV